MQGMVCFCEEDTLLLARSLPCIQAHSTARAKPFSSTRYITATFSNVTMASTSTGNPTVSTSYFSALSSSHHSADLIILLFHFAPGLSGSIYRSLNSRDNYPGITPTADTTWMTSQPKNPLAIGQFVNNGTSQFPPNGRQHKFFLMTSLSHPLIFFVNGDPTTVRYQELDITTEVCALELQEFLPNIWYSGDWHDEPQYKQSYLRTVVLVTTRTVEQDQELYSTYIEN